MPSRSETSYGNRLASAVKMAQAIQKFTPVYAEPAPDLSLTALNNLVTELQTLNGNVATGLQSYSSLVNERQLLYRTSPSSMQKLLPRIHSAVKALKGNTAQETEALRGYVTKMRSIPLKKPKTPASGTTTETTETSISQNELSYGSLAQTFADAVKVLESLTPAYNPPSADIQLPALNTMITSMNNSNAGVASAYAQLRLNREQRTEKYLALGQLSQRIKNAVKSQYGTSSVEYGLIKGLKI